jgi:flagellar biogenesis protein FliO
MVWLQNILGSDSPGTTLAMIMLGLTAAIILLFWIFRKIAGPNGRLSSRHRKQPRLSVVEAAIVDSKRRLVLIRRDKIEHLVMIGGESDFLIESNIVKPRLHTLEQEYPEIQAAESRSGAIERNEQKRVQPVVPEPAGIAAASIAPAANSDLAGYDNDRAQTVTDDPSSHDDHKNADASAYRGDETVHTSHVQKSEYDVADPASDRADSLYSRDDLTASYVAEPDRRIFDDDLRSAGIPTLPDAQADNRDTVTIDNSHDNLENALSEELAAGDETSAIQSTETGNANLPPPVNVSAEEQKPARPEPLRKDKRVEDEMQKLLDELANN